MNHWKTIILSFILFQFASFSIYGQEANLDSIHLKKDKQVELSADSSFFFPPAYIAPYVWMSPLHSGLNTQISLSATVGFGHDAPSGVGFGKGIALAWVAPINKKWNYMLATNTSSINWSAYRWNQVTIGGELNYNCTDKVSLSLFGYKDIVHSPYPFSQNYYLNRPNSFVGGAIGIKVNPNLFFQVSIGTGEIDDRYLR